MIALGIAIATVVAFVISFVFYAIVPAPPAFEKNQPANPEQARPKPWQIVVEIARSAIIACLVAGLLAAASWSGAGQGALLGLALSVLPIVLLGGSVMWEGVPLRTAIPHTADWMIKLTAIGAIIGIFS